MEIILSWMEFFSEINNCPTPIIRNSSVTNRNLVNGQFFKGKFMRFIRFHLLDLSLHAELVASLVDNLHSLH